MRIDTITRGWEAAGKYHRGQEYGVNKIPYLYHIGRVFIEALSATKGFDEAKRTRVLLTAILHDSLEDTNLTESFIADHFGHEVLELVKALTKNESIKKEEQMIDSLNRIKSLGEEAAIVKLCDRIANLSHSPPISWKQEWIASYSDESQLILNELGIFNAYLSDRLKMVLKSYKETHLK